MPSHAHLDWQGDRLIERVHNAARESVDETVDATRDDAQETHTWRNDPRRRRFSKGGPLVDPHLETQIKSEHADPADLNPMGSVGFTREKGFYGLFHERGTTHEHEYPALRPAADRQFPTIVERLRRRLP